MTNKIRASVQQRTVLRVPQKDHGDRRIRRTTHALVQAMVDLILEKRYHAITIQNLLDRADVGRSTFYSHYRSKDDLLFKSFKRMLEILDQSLENEEAPSCRVAPVKELFDHVASVRAFHRALARAHMVDRLYQVGTDHMSRIIERRLTALPPRTDGPSLPPSVTAHAFAGALFALLRWWVETEPPYSPEEMDEMYHAVCLRT